MVEANPIAAVVANDARVIEPEPSITERLIAQLREGMISTDKHLDPSQATTEIDGYFCCSICMQVVEDPKEC